MKRLFLGTTAIVAAASLGHPADAKIELGLGGYMNSYFSVAAIDEGANDPHDYNPTGLFSDGEVYFTGEVELDNGILLGAVVQLEMFGDPNSFGDTIDERYMYLESTFGRIVAGSTNMAPYAMAVFAPYAGLPINSGWVTAFVPANPDSQVAFLHPGVSTLLEPQEDSNGITYYSPNLWGFQLGLSYVPSATPGGDGKNFPVEADRETEYHNAFAVGLTYVESFDGFDVALSGSWLFAQADEQGKDDGVDDYQAFMVGANLSYAGVTLGGSYANEYQGLVDDSGTVTTEGQSYDVGASYALGPWTVAVTWFHGATEDQIAEPGEDVMHALQGGFYYALGPGITLGGGVMWVEWDAESGFTNAGVAGALGLTFEF